MIGAAQSLPMLDREPVVVQQLLCDLAQNIGLGELLRADDQRCRRLSASGSRPADSDGFRQDVGRKARRELTARSCVRIVS